MRAVWLAGWRAGGRAEQAFGLTSSVGRALYYKLEDHRFEPHPGNISCVVIGHKILSTATSPASNSGGAVSGLRSSTQ
ncbi:hypothetical protein DPMN_091492 [Dreissena polymorpha]|uniref:Uncharacterized protein n=1 Tax=Dreissena polymorpha TaxID=45954 RepID=A0A9D4L0L6_DREPO|nr:hypothetical protein DPMN_091492 [Dreissena polymorpha]